MKKTTHWSHFCLYCQEILEIVVTANYWIERLQLQSHPEGGFYKETYRANGGILSSALPSCFGGNRNFSTAIYFLLRSQDKSHFHRIKSDELWHYHAGTSLSIFVLTDRGLLTHKLGANPDNGESLQIIIPANHWFAARVDIQESYVLAGCTVSPGFDFDDFELGERNSLTKLFPSFAELIESLTPAQADQK